MLRLSSAGAGVAIDLPDGWDGTITQREPDPGLSDIERASTPSLALLHAASFSLPSDTSDFGGGAVEVMRFGDVFIALFEYGRESVGTALFWSPRPARLAVGDFDENMLQHNLPGQSGTQQFFTESGRAFCLYVVLGSHLNRARAVPLVNSVLPSITVI
ncbi:MAG: hypothetical protein OEU32_07300 [Acidimicrobiia bacterium]|nr:hypothetical protein [Acidimicrobiia bacterium]